MRNEGGKEGDLISYLEEVCLWFKEEGRKESE